MSTLAVTATAIAVLVPSASAEPNSGPAVAGAPSSATGRGPVPDASAAARSTAASAEVADEATDVGHRVTMPSSYPHQPALRIYPDNAPDSTDLNQTISHDDIAPTLMDWMKVSNRISTQVVGQSTEGRDLYLVTITAPEDEATTSQQTAWRNAIRDTPDAAAADPALAAGYKTPIWFSSNIHGNEWEGTDASMQMIEDLVSAPWQEVSNLLRGHRLYFSLSLNPDGRTKATRATALSLDANRDMITSATPESISFVETTKALQPLYAADFHGYTNVLQVEPCGPPHGENYEYDLLIPHGYALARRVEDDVVAAAIPGNTYYNTATRTVVSENTGPDTAHIKIPYRDTPSGWDDYPPIFTAQYAAFHGAVSNTVELPKGRTGSTTTPANAQINTAVAKQTMESMVDYVAEHSDAMLANQIEMFRRGVAGEPKAALTGDNIADVEGPQEWKSLWDVADDQDPVSLPRAYVIPVGDDQRSMSDASRLVDQLLFNGIEVGRLDASTVVGSATYPAGSYVVDMHQPLRGLANSLLDLGSDISQKVPSMYDISAWSYSYLWGATVAKVGSTTDGPIGATTPVRRAASVASLPAARDYLTFDVAGIADFQALNALLELEVPVAMLSDGSAVVAPEGYDEASTVAEDFDIEFEASSDDDLAALDDEDTRPLGDLTIGYTGNQDDKLSLTELGFDDLVPVTATGITTDPTVLDTLDVLWVGANLTFTDTQVAGRTAVQDWVGQGHSIVGRGTAAFNAAKLFGLVSGTAVSGNSSGNGIVAVDTPDGSVLEPHQQDHAFVYPAVSFTGLGEGTRVEQAYGADNPLLAGHWRGTSATNGPEYAAGLASAISGETASGARGFVFGTSVFFRTHPKGGLSNAARALFWAGPEGVEVPAPQDTSVVLGGTSPITYPEDATFGIQVDAIGDAEPTGSVELVDEDDTVLATGPLVDGAAGLDVAGLRPGSTTVTAVYTPDDPAFEASASEPLTVQVLKAPSATALEVRKLGSRKVEATVEVTAPEVVPVGTVALKDKGEVVRTFTVSAPDGGVRTVTLRLAPGKHRLVAVFKQSELVKRSESEAVSFNLR